MGGIRSKLGNVADKAKELGESVAEVAAEAGGTVAGKVAAAGGTVAERAKEGARLAADAQLEARRRKYAPVFPGEFWSPDYDLPNMGLFGGFCGRDSGIGPAQRAKTTIWN